MRVSSVPSPSQRTAEDLEVIYEELLHVKAAAHLSTSVSIPFFYFFCLYRKKSRGSTGVLSPLYRPVVNKSLFCFHTCRCARSWQQYWSLNHMPRPEQCVSVTAPLTFDKDTHSHTGLYCVAGPVHPVNLHCTPFKNRSLLCPVLNTVSNNCSNVAALMWSLMCSVVFSQGDKGTSWYIIWKGSVNVITHGKVRKPLTAIKMPTLENCNGKTSCAQRGWSPRYMRGRILGSWLC